MTRISSRQSLQCRCTSKSFCFCTFLDMISKFPITFKGFCAILAKKCSCHGRVFLTKFQFSHHLSFCHLIPRRNSFSSSKWQAVCEHVLDNLKKDYAQWIFFDTFFRVLVFFICTHFARQVTARTNLKLTWKKGKRRSTRRNALSSSWSRGFQQKSSREIFNSGAFLHDKPLMAKTCKPPKHRRGRAFFARLV